ncbi:thioesterase family protein [Nonomuraea sp. CA-143628]|uniref:thioesterase family protein n=1 Tax=Nonomuraea sp. CA-143628 TaxID=3239997 RepID=UPI003D8F513A
MAEGLVAGLEHEFAFLVPQSKVVAGLYPESAEFGVMPPVFATGFLVGLLEWTCVRAVLPYLDWPREQTVGTRVDITHQAPTPAGMTVTCRVRLVSVEGRRLRFEVAAGDGVDVIGEGTHERVIIDAERFTARALAKGEPS